MQGSFAQDVLVECEPAEEVTHCGRLVAVRKTLRGWQGVAPDPRDYFDPVSLNDDEVRQVLIDVNGIVDRLRIENEIVGLGPEQDGNVFTVGQKNVDGYGNVEVYLSIENGDPASFATRCRGLRMPHGAARVVVLIPRPVTLPSSDRQLIDSHGVVLMPLAEAAERGDLSVDWQRAFMSLQLQRPDGYYPPGIVVWKSHEHKCKLTAHEQRFIAVAIEEQFIEVSKLMHNGDDAVWQGRFLNTKQQRQKINAVLSRLNRKLEKAKPRLPVSFGLKRQDNYIERKVADLVSA